MGEVAKLAKIIGELGVEITADDTGLAEEIRSKVEAAVREAATSQLALSVDTASLARKLQDAIKAAKATAGNLKISVELNDDGFIPAVEAEVKKAQAIAGDVKFGVELGVAGVDQAQLAEEVRKSLTLAQADVPALKVKIELDDNGFVESVQIAVEKAKAEVSKIKIGLDIDAGALAAKVKLAAEIASRESTIKPKVDPKTAEADFETFATGLRSKLSGLQGAFNGFASGFFSSVFSVSKWSSIVVGAAQAATSVINLSGALGVLPGVVFAGVTAIAALKIGVSGFGQAIKDIGTDKFGQDLAKLAPSARDTAQAIAGIKPQLDQLKLDVQQQLFEGLGNAVRTLGSQLLPILNTGLSGMATVLNSGAQQVTAFFSAATVKNDLATAFGAAQAGVANLLQALPSVLSIFRDLGTVGAEAFANVTGGAAAAAQKVADFVARARESGALGNFITLGVAAFEELGHIIANVLSILNTLLGAFGGGAGILGLLFDLTNALRAFLATAQGQAAITALGQAMQQIAASAGQVFLALLQSLGQILADHAPDIAAFAKALGDDLVSAINVLAPLLSGLLTAIGAHPELFANIALGAIALAGALNILVPIVTVVTTLIAAGTVGLVAAIVAAVVTAVILIILNFDKIKAAVGAALDAIGQFFVFLGTTIANAFGVAVAFVEGIWNGVVSFFVGIGTAIGSAVSSAIGAVGQFFADGFNAVVTFVGTAVLSIISFFIALPGQVLAFIAAIPAQAGAFISQLAFDFGFAVGAILRFFIDLPQNVVNAVGVLITDIGLFSVNFGLTLISGFTTAFDAVITFVTTVPGQIIDALISLAIDIYNWGIGVWVQANIAFLNGVGAVIQFAATLPNRVISAVQQLVGLIISWGANVWSQALSAFNNGVANVLSFVRSLPGNVINAIGNLGNKLYQVGVDALNGLLNGLKSIVGNILGWVKGLVGDILGGFTSGFNSHSPSRETYSIGQDVAAGLANALRDARGLVGAAAGDLAQAGLDGLSPILNPTVNTTAVANGISAAANSLTTNPAGGVNYTVNQTNLMQQGTDVNQFADAVLKNGAAALSSGASLLGVSQLGVQAGINPNLLAVSGV
jgi:hypothetical protein